MAKLVIIKGKTFRRKLRPASLPYIYKAITAITKSGPVTITCPSHGLVTGQLVVVVSAKGMTQINAVAFNNLTEFSRRANSVTVVDPNTVTINNINSSDYYTYTSGGYLQFLTPKPLAGNYARMSIKDKVGGTELLRLDTENSRIALDDVLHTITLTVDAITTAALTWKTGIYDLELISADIVAGSFVVGRSYKIKSIGSTDFMLVGAASNTVGLTFTATGIGVGTGKVEGEVSLVLPLDSISVENESTTT